VSHRKKYFTLIELSVIIAISGILAATIILINLNTARNKAASDGKTAENTELLDEEAMNYAQEEFARINKIVEECVDKFTVLDEKQLIKDKLLYHLLETWLARRDKGTWTEFDEKMYVALTSMLASRFSMIGAEPEKFDWEVRGEF
jgi:type II secretory pathway pseudopilin PulG